MHLLNCTNLLQSLGDGVDRKFAIDRRDVDDLVASCFHSTCLAHNDVARAS
jgi:hypothetical protein